MEHPKLINNITERVADDLKKRLSRDSSVSVTAASFSIYAFEALKKELEDVEELRFIFTSPTFIKERPRKKSVNITFQNLTASVVSMEQILRFVSVTSFHKKL